MKPKDFSQKLAVVGATGAVGREMLDGLISLGVRADQVLAFASERSVGKAIPFGEKSLICERLSPGCFKGIQFVFFDASDEVSKTWVEDAARAGAWVIDNSATFRMDPEVVLFVPEVNEAQALKQLDRAKQTKNANEWKSRVFAGPNCSTVQLVMALAPLGREFGLKRVQVSTYQSTSGAGSAAMEELVTQTKNYLAGGPSACKSEIFPHPIAFNCIPQIGKPSEDGFTSEEKKLMAETKKILDLPNLKVAATAVRVPTLRTHAETVSVEFERPVNQARAREVLTSFCGVVVEDAPERGVYPLAWSKDPRVLGGTGRDEVFVGRLRLDPSTENGLMFWIVSDNLRKGAASNALAIGLWLSRHL